MWLAGTQPLSPRIGGAGISALYMPLAILFYAFYAAPRFSARVGAAAAFAAAGLAHAALAGSSALAMAPFLALDVAEAAALTGFVRGTMSGRHGPRTPLRAFVHVGGALAVAGAAGAVSATMMGPLGEAAGFGAKAWATAWRDWTLGDATAFLSLGGVLMVAGRPGLRLGRRDVAERPAEFAAAVGFLMVAILYDFESLEAMAALHGPAPHPALVFLTLPALLWLSWRFRRVGAAAAVLLTAVPSVHLVAAGWGPRWMADTADRVTILQAYILASALVAFLVASLAEQVERRRRRAEAALRQAARRALDRADFLAGLSHEMRTPLNGVLGFAHLLATGPLPDKAREQALVIEESGRRLLTLIERALDVNRLRIGHAEPSWETVALRPLAEAALARAAAEAAARGVALDASDCADIAIDGAAAALDLAIGSLVANAVEHARAGGKVSARVRDRGGWVEITVADDGPGFSPGFALGSQRLTRMDGRAGLGLHIVDLVAVMHEGALSLGSAPGGGAAATLRLPLARPGPANPQDDA
jgi:signal transduction histidine kinase